MKKVLLGLVAFVAIALTGCQVEPLDESITVNDSVTIEDLIFTGSVEARSNDMTRTGIAVDEDGNIDIVWYGEEQVNVYASWGKQIVLESVVDEDDPTTCGFKQVGDQADSDWEQLDRTGYIAVYPYNEENAVDADGVITMDLSNLENQVANNFTFGNGTAAAVAYTESSDTAVNFNFRSVTSFIKVALTLEGDAKENSIKIDNVVLAGTTALAADKATVKKEDIAEGNCAAVAVEGQEIYTINYDAGEEVFLNSENPTYEAVIPVLAGAQTFTVTVNGTNTFTGIPYVVNTKEITFNFERNKIHALRKTITDSEVREIADGVEQEDKKNHYTLTNAQGLLWLAEQVNVEKKNFAGYTFCLGNDIDMTGVEWTPIGKQGVCYFQGNFDGQEKTIRNLTCEAEERAGLFGYKANSSSIKNVFFENVTLKGKVSGALAGYLQNTTVENIKVTGTLNVTGEGTLGAVVGHAFGCGFDNIVVDVDNSTKNIQASGQIVGGIIGSTNTVTLNNSSSNAYVYSLGRSGGLIGSVSKVLNADNCNTNNAIIYTINNSSSTDIYTQGQIGRLVGSYDQGYGGQAVLTNCESNATLTKTGGKSFASYPNEFANDGWVGAANAGLANDNNTTISVNGVTYENIKVPTNYDDAWLSSRLRYVEGSERVFADKIYVYLCRDAALDINGTYALGGENTTDIVFIGLDKTLTLNQTSTGYNYLAAKNPEATIALYGGRNTYMNVVTTGENTGYWYNTHFHFNSKMKADKVNFSNPFNVEKDATLYNVNIDIATDDYALWITGNGQNVEMNAVVINAANELGGRGLKIFDNDGDQAQKVSIKMTACQLNTNKKAGILVHSKAGATIYLTGGTKFNTAADRVNAVWTDEARYEYFDATKITGHRVVMIDENGNETTAKVPTHIIEGSEIFADGGVTMLKDTYFIQNRAGWDWFVAQVNNENNSFAGKTVVLATDLNFSYGKISAVGTNDLGFRGTFDGADHKIEKFKITGAGEAGLFAKLEKGAIKNLNVSEATISGNHYAGGIVAWVQAESYSGWQGAPDAVVSNCTVTASTITSTPEKVDGEYDNGDKVGGIAGYVSYGTVTECSVDNTNINGYRDLGGIVGFANYNADNGKGSVVTKNTVGENVVITASDTYNYKEYIDYKDYDVNHIVGEAAEGAVVEDNTGTATLNVPMTDIERLNLQIEEAANGSTITLEANIETLPNEQIVVAAGKEITLNLNGKNIVGQSDVAGTFALINNNGNLTITGEGKIAYTPTEESISTTNGYANNTISNRGVLVVEGGVIENNSTKGGACYAIDNYAGSTCTINGGEISARATVVRIFHWGGEKATLTVNGGTITSEVAYNIQTNVGNTPNVDLTITGGKFINNDETYNLVAYIYASATPNLENFKVKVSGGEWGGNFALSTAIAENMVAGNVVVSGGKFNGAYGAYAYGEPNYGFITGGTYKADPTDYCAVGYLPYKNADDTYTVEHVYDVDEDGAYVITHVKGMKWFANEVNVNGNNFAGKTVKLGANIDLNNEEWTPIGFNDNAYNDNSNVPFAGTFDGQEYTISNLKMDKENRGGLGLFGAVKGATIKNLTITNVDIKAVDSTNSNTSGSHMAGGWIGAVAGYDMGGTITFENVHVNGIIKIEGDTVNKSGQRVAGIIGGGTVGSPVVFNNVSVVGDAGSYIKGYCSTAGIMGQNQGHGTFTNVHTDIDITTYSFGAGGIVGIVKGGSTIENCSSKGNITRTQPLAATASNSHYRIGGFAGCWSGTELILNNCSYTGTLTTYDENGNAATSALDTYGYVGREYNYGNYPDGTRKVTVNGIEFVDKGKGMYTVNGIYEIWDVKALKWIATAVNGGNSLSGQTVKLMADLDLKGEAWTPIGTSSNAFKGTFDGNNKTISNLNIFGGSYSGLFGNAWGAKTIKNFTINNANVTGVTYVAAVAGCVVADSIEDITVTGNVNITGIGQDIAVIAGYTYSDMKNITIDVNEGSYVEADTYDMAGAIAGYKAEGNTGHTYVNDNLHSNIDVITLSGRSGGLFGVCQAYNTITNSSCSGDVIIENSTSYYRSYQIGGIIGAYVGKNVTVTNCEFTGNYSITRNGAEVSTENLPNEGLVGMSWDSGVGVLTIDGATYDTYLVNSSASMDSAMNNWNAANKYVVYSTNVEIADKTYTVPSGKNVVMNMNDFTLTSSSSNTSGNYELFLVKGDMKVIDGTINHTCKNNLESAMGTIYDITAGGKLTLNNVKNNISGTWMSFVAHLNNWGEATLVADKCEFNSNYCGVRVFNSGYDDNNVTISNSKLSGNKMAFWVHNYIGDLDKTNHPDEAVNARLNINIYGAQNNEFVVTDDAYLSPIRFGFSNTTCLYVDPETGQFIPKNNSGFKAEADSEVIDW